MSKLDQVQLRPYPPAYLGAEELAFWLNCSERVIASYTKEKLLPPPIRIGNLIRWCWTDVKDHIAEQAALAQPAGDGDEYALNVVKLKAATRRLTKEAGDDSAS